LWPVERKFHADLFISTGGMPSSHTAMHQHLHDRGGH
jgi:acid phosphatase family membrane protein YuiD